MEPLLSTIPQAARNVPRDLQARLYREIGVAAVAAALDAGHAGSPALADPAHGYGPADRWMETLPMSDETVRAA